MKGKALRLRTAFSVWYVKDAKLEDVFRAIEDGQFYIQIEGHESIHAGDIGDKPGNVKLSITESNSGMAVRLEGTYYDKEDADLSPSCVDSEDFTTYDESGNDLRGEQADFGTLPMTGKARG